MFNLKFKISLKLNFKFIPTSISFEEQFKFYLISVFLFQGFFESDFVLFLVLKI